MRYIWSTFLLIAAVFAPNAITAIILFISGLLNLLLSLLRERRVSRLTDELSDVLAIKRKTSSVALERSLSDVQKTTMGLALVAEFIVFCALLFGALDITVARNYALLILIALAPLGLELELFALLRSKQKRESETVRTAVGYATEDAWALLAIIGLSFVGTIWFYIPPALSAMQILFITLVARPFLSGRALQALPHKTSRVWRVSLTAFIVYGSFIFFFIRHYLEPRYADATNVQVWQATSVAFAVFVACQSGLIFFEAKRLPKIRLLFLYALLAAAVYGAGALFWSAAIGFDDWMWVLLGGSSFAAIMILLYRRNIN